MTTPSPETGSTGAPKEPAAPASPADASAAPPPAPPPDDRPTLRYFGRTPVSTTLDAYDSIEAFRAAHAALLEQNGLTPAMVAAGKAAHDELATSGLARKSAPPDDLPIAMETLRRLLHAGRDAILRRTREESLHRWRKIMGLGKRLDNNQQSLADCAKAFLSGAATERGQALSARPARMPLVPAAFATAVHAAAQKLKALSEREVDAKRRRAGTSAEFAYAHKALEDYFDEFAAAVNFAFAMDPTRRLEGLLCVPRDRDARAAHADLPPE